MKHNVLALLLPLVAFALPGFAQDEGEDGFSGPLGQAGDSQVAHVNFARLDPDTGEFLPRRQSSRARMTYFWVGNSFDFVFNGHGFLREVPQAPSRRELRPAQDPDRLEGGFYMLTYQPEPFPSPDVICLGAGRVNPGGNLHLAGAVEIHSHLPPDLATGDLATDDFDDGDDDGEDGDADSDDGDEDGDEQGDDGDSEDETGAVNLRLEFESTGVDPDARGSVKYEENPNFINLKIQGKKLPFDPNNVYQVLVGGMEVGRFEVNRGGNGGLFFSSEARPNWELLDFDPLDQTIEIAQDGTVFLTALLDSALLDSDDEDEGDEDGDDSGDDEGGDEGDDEGGDEGDDPVDGDEGDTDDGDATSDDEQQGATLVLVPVFDVDCEAGLMNDWVPEDYLFSTEPVIFVDLDLL